MMMISDLAMGWNAITVKDFGIYRFPCVYVIVTVCFVFSYGH